MSRLTPEQRAILNLRGEIPEGTMAYLTREDAYALLKKHTNQDFGYDADKWEKWIEENGLPMLGIPSDTEFDNAFFAALEFEKEGFTERKCLRCGGKFIITIKGNSYDVQCEKKDFTLKWTSQ
jgi:hypothetical protein